MKLLMNWNMFTGVRRLNLHPAVEEQAPEVPGSVMAGRLLLRPDDGDSVVVASHPNGTGLLPHRSIAPVTIHGIG